MKFKDISKLICCLLTVTCISSISIPIITVYATTNNISTKKDFTIKDTSASKVYNDLIKSNSESSLDSYSNKNTVDSLSYNKNSINSYYKITNDNHQSDISSNSESPYIGDFEELNLSVSKDAKETDTLYLDKSDSTETIIRYHENTETYSLVESNKITGELLYIVNGTPYKIIAEGENINMYSESGDVIPVLITEYIDSPKISPTNIDNNIDNSSVISSAIAKSSISNPLIAPTSSIATTNNSFGPNYGPYYKTNKVAVDLISDLSTVAGFVTFKHPLIGTITTLAGTITWFLGKSYATLYIKYYQAFSTSNPTYVKETAHYYKYNNYTGLVKTIVSYFYSSKPY